MKNPQLIILMCAGLAGAFLLGGAAAQTPPQSTTAPAPPTTPPAPPTPIPELYSVKFQNISLRFSLLQQSIDKLQEESRTLVAQTCTAVNIPVADCELDVQAGTVKKRVTPPAPPAAPAKPPAPATPAPAK